MYIGLHVKYILFLSDFNETCNFSIDFRKILKYQFYYNHFFYVSLTVHLSITLTNDQLDAQILIHLLQSCTCTCFEQYLAHPQQVKLY
jgi:hypothetical protein